MEDKRVAALEAVRRDRREFEAKFIPIMPPPGTPFRRRIFRSEQARLQRLSTSPENVATRLRLCDRARRLERRVKAAQAAKNRARDPKAQLRAWVFKRLRKMGFQREKKTVSGSAYYRLHDLCVRVSDHDVPMTNDRYWKQLAGRRTWADNAMSLTLGSPMDAARWLVMVRRIVARRVNYN